MGFRCSKVLQYLILINASKMADDVNQQIEDALNTCSGLFL